MVQICCTNVCAFVTERPLHPKEKVLEQALQWCKMADPSSAYLVVKKVPKGEAIDIFTCEYVGHLDVFIKVVTH